MTIKELKDLLNNLPSIYDNYIITTEDGYQGFDGDIIINDALNINLYVFQKGYILFLHIFHLDLKLPLLQSLIFVI